MKVDNLKKVSVAYTLTVDGAVADQATAEKPLEFIFGIGQLLPKFEEAILGKEVGEKAEITLEPKDGYGEIQPVQKIDFPKADFFREGADVEEVNQFLKVGGLIPLYTPNGQMVPGKIVEIGEDKVTLEVDINHPMAGKTLNFTIEVVAVRELSEEEMEQLRNPKHGCGCGCGHDHCGEGDCNCDHDHCGDEGCNCGK